MSVTYSRQSPPSCNHRTDIKVGVDDSFAFRRLKPTKAIEHLRILLSKAWYREEEFSELDHSYLIHVWNYIQEIEDSEFLVLNKERLKEADFAMRMLVIHNTIHVSDGFINSQRQLGRKEKDVSKHRILLSPRSFNGMLKLFKTSDFVIKQNRRLRARLPPTRYIGVGYKDKGARRNVTVDGTPAWQEVASLTSEELELARRARKLFWKKQIFRLT